MMQRLVAGGPVCGCRPARRVQHGVALVAVMWIVAALTLLVAGMLAVSKAEVRAAQTRAQVGGVTGLGDAAIQLAVLDWRTAPVPPDRLLRTRYRVDGVPISVAVIPASGYIDVNTAPETLLQALFVHGAGASPELARTLGQRIIDWRDPDDAALPDGAEAEAYATAGVAWRPRNGRFIVLEDLMQVLGLDFEMFDMIRPFVTVWSGSGQGVNPLAAPPEVLAILAAGNRDRAELIAAARDAGDPAIDMTMLEQAHLNSGSGGNILHVLASVPAGQGRFGVRGRWIQLSPDEDGAPWKTISAEPVRFVELARGAG